MSLLFHLMYEFFKTGLFAVGGGLATLPFLYEMGEKTGWFTQQDILNLLAVSESTPGAIGINMSTYVGYICSGVSGAILATISLAAPSIIVIILISRILDKFKGSPLVEGIFKGLRPASVGLITAALLSVTQKALFRFDQFHGFGRILTVFNWPAIALAVVLFLLMRKWKTHPIVFLAIAAAVGIAFSF